MKRLKGEKLLGYVIILPAVLYMLIFIGYPIIYNWILSLQDVTAKSLKSDIKNYVGLKNYIDIFSDPVFRDSILHTFIYTIGCLVIQFSFGFLFAMFFAKKFTFSKPIRGFIVISWMLPVTVTALIFKFMLADNGVINTLLLKFRLIKEPIGWLLKGETSMLGLIIANSWVGIPFNMLLLTTGLNDIPQEIYEAAALDGANKKQQLFRITVPLLKQTILSVLVLGFVLTFKVFDLVYVMTGGGPVNSTQVLSTYSYKLSFELFKFSKGAATANVLFICLLIVALVYLRVSTKEE